MMQRIHLPLILAATLSTAALTTAQTPTTPPPSQHPILTVTGKGVQIFTCRQSAAGPQWVFQAPEATLIDASGNPIGTHGAGPIWKSKDGSTVKGELLQKSASPDATSIPWLLLKAVSPSGSGIMTRVEYIRRSDTQGGSSPATGCDAQHLSAISRVPYTATYTFYSATP
jgi:Protein of unknown function (DUF3455)